MAKIAVQIEEVELPIALEGKPQEEGSPDIVQPLIINIVLDPSGEKKGLSAFSVPGIGSQSN